METIGNFTFRMNNEFTVIGDGYKDFRKDVNFVLGTVDYVTEFDGVEFRVTGEWDYDYGNRIGTGFIEIDDAYANFTYSRFELTSNLEAAIEYWIAQANNKFIGSIQVLSDPTYDVCYAGHTLYIPTDAIGVEFEPFQILDYELIEDSIDLYLE